MFVNTLGQIGTRFEDFYPTGINDLISSVRQVTVIWRIYTIKNQSIAYHFIYRNKRFTVNSVTIDDYTRSKFGKREKEDRCIYPPDHLSTGLRTRRPNIPLTPLMHKWSSAAINPCIISTLSTAARAVESTIGTSDVSAQNARIAKPHCHWRSYQASRCNRALLSILAKPRWRLKHFPAKDWVQIGRIFQSIAGI